MIRLIFYREGFAHNSSSSHSIIFSRGWPVGSIPQESYSDEGDEGPHFGWDAFVLTSPQEKAEYFAAQLRSYVYSKVSSWVRQVKDVSVPFPQRMVLSWLEQEENILEDTYNWLLSPDMKAYLPPFELCGTVDHQSQIQFPLQQGVGLVHKEMLHKLYDLLVRDNHVVIKGGNDNGDDNGDDTPTTLSRLGVEQIPLVELSLEQAALRDLVIKLRDGEHSCHKIGDRDAYVLSSKESGSLSIYAFDGLPVHKLDVPYLVDIKITDVCPYGCEFCYQDSVSTRGIDSGRLQWDTCDLLDSLARLGTMEVVLGGGEPTLSPYITYIMERAIQNGLKVSITTKNYDMRFWQAASFLANDKSRPHSIAFSVHSYEDAKALIELEEFITQSAYDKRRINVVAQVVVGVMPLEEFKDACYLLADEGIGITFLGYKTNGRGATFQPRMSLEEFTSVLEGMVAFGRIGFAPIGVDSTIAIACKEQLKQLGVKEHLLTTREGAYTCYVDVPRKLIGPSSFCADTEMHQLPIMYDHHDIRSKFETF